MKTEEKLDLYKANKDEYSATRKPALVEVGPAKYLSVTGQGAPGGEAFQAAIGALYSMAFTIKMTRKFAGKGDYAVCKLEGLWWTDEGEGDFSRMAPEKWRWQLIIRTPDFIGRDDLDRAVATLEKKGKGAGVQDVALESITEGFCVQMLHVGPYDREGESVALMRKFAEGKGYEIHGRHHEIYISDPRRVPPERLKTILRLPVRKKD